MPSPPISRPAEMCLLATNLLFCAVRPSTCLVHKKRRNSEKRFLYINKNFCFQKHFHKNIYENFRFHKHFCGYVHFPNIVMPWLPCPGTYQADLSSSTCLCCPVPVVRSQMSCPRCPVLTSLSCPGCPVPAVLVFQLPCPAHFVHCSPDTAVISRQSCHSVLSISPIQAHLSRLTCRADLL
jgi:hypothetical protein